MAETEPVSPHLLTDVQLDTLIAVAALCSKHGYSPTVREIQAEVGVPIGAVHSRLKRLQRKGLIDWQPGMARTIRITGGADAIVAAHGIEP